MPFDKNRHPESHWHGPDMASRTETWLFHVTPEELAELKPAAEYLVAHNDKDNGHLSLNPLKEVETLFDFHHLKRRIDFFSRQLHSGPGFFLWRGMPVDTWSREVLAASLLIIGNFLGNLRQQNAKGHVLGHVKDLGTSSSDPNVRVYQTRERQTFHTDSCDVVGLLCLQVAKSGGLSALVSSYTVFQEMLLRNEELALLMLQPFPKDRRGEVGQGKKPYFNIPVYHQYEGYLSAIYQRQYIDSSQRFQDAPRLTRKQVQALNLFDSLCDDPSLHFTMKLERGDMQFVNNHALLHDRTGFEDWTEPSRKRHLLRMWIAPRNNKGARPLPEVYAERYGSVIPGHRGGVNVDGVESIAPLDMRRE